MSERTAQLLPPQAKGHTSVARVADDWYVVCLSKELRRKPLSVTLLGSPLVLFRSADGTPRALLDRCPHRNVPLSLGQVKGNQLECCYHGWQFDGAGQCRHIPGLTSQAIKPGRRVSAYATKEQQGVVWVYGSADAEPTRQPFRFPLTGDPKYTSVYDVVQAEASVHAVAENALDVPHTAFLHGGLFRTADGPKHPVEVIVRRWHDRAEAEFVGEPRPKGLVGKLLAPKGGVVEHFDRFFLPSVVQVEYKLGTRVHFCTTAALTPVADFQTKLFSVVSFRLPLPGWLVKPFLRPIATRIFKQDAWMLKEQTATIQRFGGEQFMSTEIDVLGAQISRLLLQAQRGERPAAGEPDGEPVVKKVIMQT